MHAENCTSYARETAHHMHAKTAHHMPRQQISYHMHAKNCASFARQTRSYHIRGAGTGGAEGAAEPPVLSVGKL